MTLLEREGEVAAIEGLLDAAREGRGNLALIEGEAGVGKSSLLALAAEQAGGREMLVLRSRGGENERGFAYGIIRQLFEGQIAEQGGDERFAGAAGLCAPVFDLTIDRGGTDRLAIQHGIYWLTADLAATQPLVVVIDDAQWADAASLQALSYVAHRLEDLPLAVILGIRTAEPDAPYDLIEPLRREPHAHVLAPAALSLEAAADLGREQLGADASDAFLGACHEACGGNPFLLGELLRRLAESEISPTDANASSVTEHASEGAARSILLRLHRLGDDAIEFARAVAVLEQSAEAELIGALSGLDHEALVVTGERLIEARLLEDGWPMSFVHPLIRRAIYDEISAPRRAAMHRTAATRLEELGAPPGVSAAHLMQVPPAGDADAAATLRAAAKDARARGAPDAAASYLRRAMSEPPTDSEILGVRRELGSALLEAADPSGIEELLAVRSAVDDPAQRAELVPEIATSYNLRGHQSEAQALLDETLAELDPDHEREAVLRLEGLRLVSTVLMGGQSISHDELMELVDGLEGKSRGERSILTAADLLLAVGLGRIEDAVALAERVVADPDALVEDARAGFTRGNSALALAFADRTDRALTILDGQLEACRQRGSATSIGIVTGYRGWIHHMRGSLVDAQLDADLSVGLLRETGLATTWLGGVGVRLAVQFDRGDLDDADEMLRSLGLDGSPSAGVGSAAFLCARGQLRLAQGRCEEADADFRLAEACVGWLPCANPEPLGWRTGLAQSELALGRESEARALAEEAVERAREAGGRRGLGIALRVAGVVAGAEGIDRLRESVDTLAQTSGTLLHARALVDLGAALRRANHRKEAREPLRGGLELASRCGATPLEERARTELAATGARPRSAVLSGVASLTPSEMRVARLASSGMTNREIAQELFVTVKTVEYHLRHCFQKLEIERRGELEGVLE